MTQVKKVLNFHDSKNIMMIADYVAGRSQRKSRKFHGNRLRHAVRVLSRSIRKAEEMFDQDRLGPSGIDLVRVCWDSYC